jgi:hypothetical protein
MEPRLLDLAIPIISRWLHPSELKRRCFLSSGPLEPQQASRRLGISAKYLTALPLLSPPSIHHRSPATSASYLPNPSLSAFSMKPRPPPGAPDPSFPETRDALLGSCPMYHFCTPNQTTQKADRRHETDVPSRFRISISGRSPLCHV